MFYLERIFGGNIKGLLQHKGERGGEDNKLGQIPNTGQGTSS